MRITSLPKIDDIEGLTGYMYAFDGGIYRDQVAAQCAGGIHEIALVNYIGFSEIEDMQTIVHNTCKMLGWTQDVITLLKVENKGPFHKVTDILDSFYPPFKAD